MIRTQISFTAEQHHELATEAKRRGTSMAAIVRAAVDRLLDDHQRRRAALASAAGVAASGLGDLSERHDHYRGAAD